MKGIILAGGTGSRLFPTTLGTSKQLLPIYDKPLIYYPISVLLLSGIQEILIISTPEDQKNYQNLLGTGEQLGISFSYQSQKTPRGLAEAFILGEEFIGDDSVCLALGDNVFYGQGFSTLLQRAKESTAQGFSCVFGYPVSNPSDFGVVEFDENNQVISIQEKPQKPKSPYAVPGLYFYNHDVVEIAKQVQPSPRGELEITSINQAYLQQKRLTVTLMGRGMAWLDTGSPQGMLKASEFVHTVQEMQGFYIACIEELAWRQGFIDKAQLKKLGQTLSMTDYGQYILDLSRDSS